MKFRLDVKKSVIFGLVIAVVALVIGYLIIAKNANGAYVPVYKLLGLSKGLFKDVTNAPVFAKTLQNIRVTLIGFVIGGFGIGFVGGSIRK